MKGCDGNASYARYPPGCISCEHAIRGVSFIQGHLVVPVEVWLRSQDALLTIGDGQEQRRLRQSAAEALDFACNVRDDPRIYCDIESRPPANPVEKKIALVRAPDIVRDVLHVLRKDGTWIGEEDGFFQITETRKVYQYLERTDYNDSIEYIYSLTQMVLKPWIDSIEVIEDTITEVIKPYPGFDKLPGEPIFEEYSQDNITTYEYFTMTAGEHLIKTFSNYWFQFSGEDCWTLMHYDGIPLTTYYIKGLGGPYYPYHALSGSLLHQEPVYYEKGGESWGVPIDVTNVQDIQVVENIKIYPNPAKDVLTVNIAHAGSGSYTLRLYDTNSRLINTKELQPGDNVLNVSHLTPGLYFLIISNRLGTLEARKILVQ